MFYEDVTNLNFELVVNRTYILNDAGSVLDSKVIAAANSLPSEKRQ